MAWTGINDVLETLFPGSLELRNGYVYVDDRPGLGIDFYEHAVKQYPCNNVITMRTQTRLPDGTMHGL